jgi:Zn-dependent peptidase ImmA (M78 family)
MRWDEIEKRADELLAKVPASASPEVPVETVARQLGLPVMKVDLGEGVSGILVTEGDRSYIGVQKNDHIHRRRWSTAHEIGHYCLEDHREEGVHVDQVPSITYRYRSVDSAGTRKEAEANHFAACLLLPAQRMKEEARKLAPGGALNDMHVEELSRRFKVSPAAMTIRLQVLGLVKQ